MSSKKKILSQYDVEVKIFSLQLMYEEYDSLMFSLLNDRKWEQFRKGNSDAIEIMVGIIRERQHEIDAELDALVDKYAGIKKEKETKR